MTSFGLKQFYFLNEIKKTKNSKIIETLFNLKIKNNR